MNLIEIDLKPLPENLREWVDYEITLSNAHDCGVKLMNKRRIDLDGLGCSGFFRDDDPQLVVACAKPAREWVKILVHETCHRDQWIEQCPEWRKTVNGHDPLTWLDEWLRHDTELRGAKLSAVLTASAAIELDCEKRSVEKIKEFELPIDLWEYRKKANAYVWFYQAMRYSRRWWVKGKSPYQVDAVWKAMPNDFDNDYTKIPRKFKDLILEHCF
jgi:hypothetical protein